MPTKTKSGSFSRISLLNSLPPLQQRNSHCDGPLLGDLDNPFKDGQHIGQDFLFCSEEVDRVAFSLAKWSNSCIKSMPATRSGTE